MAFGAWDLRWVRLLILQTLGCSTQIRFEVGKLEIDVVIRPSLALAPGLFEMTPEKVLRLSAMIGDVVIFMLLLIRKRYVVDKVRGVARAALDFGS